ncbi:MAG: hypothetical protein ACRDO2_15090, partial [Nocardioidaceae bacterium]
LGAPVLTGRVAISAETAAEPDEGLWTGYVDSEADAADPIRPTTSDTEECSIRSAVRMSQQARHGVLSCGAGRAVNATSVRAGMSSVLGILGLDLPAAARPFDGGLKGKSLVLVMSLAAFSRLSRVRDFLGSHPTEDSCPLLLGSSRFDLFAAATWVQAHDA